MADKKDTVTMDIPLLIRVLELAREDLKSDMDLHRVVEKLIDIRHKGTLTMDDYDYVAHIKKKVSESLDEMKKTVDVGGTSSTNTTDLEQIIPRKKKGAIRGQTDTLKDPYDQWSAKYNMEEYLDETTRTLNSYISTLGYNPKFMTRNQKQKFAQSEKYALWVRTHDDKVRQDLYQKQKEKEQRSGGDKQQQNETMMGKLANSFIPEGDQIDESGVYSVDDPKGTMTRVAENSRRRELSKSARLIKALYKKHGMKKEDMYDWEKDDKALQKESSLPEEKDVKFKASSVIKGGKTLTGQKRDVVEIDPELVRAKKGMNSTD